VRQQNYLFKVGVNDNVATALANLKAGQTVPVLSAEGRQVVEIRLRAHVPIFFKVALEELHDGDAVRKWGHDVGTVVSRVYHHEAQPEETPLNVPAGMVVHVGNFIPSDDLLKFWNSDIAHAANTIVEKYCSNNQFAPYEFGVAKRQIAVNGTIRAGDIDFKGMRNLLLPPENDFIVGRTVETIAQQTRFRLGCCQGGKFMFPGETENVEVIQKFYRFLKGRFHEIA